MSLFLFAAGAAVGSFLKVATDRYRPDLFLFDRRIIGGRSHCPHCRAQLRWFELVPVMSYLWQCGKCRTCGRAIDWQCPAVEIVTGILFVLIPATLATPYLPPATYYLLSFSWIFAFSVLLLLSPIDFRLRIIPDEAHILLVLAGVGIALSSPFGAFEGSFLGPYAGLFGIRQNIWVNHVFAAFIAAAFFGALVFATKGRGMGAGDFKLASALGFLFGWPDILLVLSLSFIIGSCAGITAIVARKKHMASKIAFGPFLGAAALAVFLFGYPLMRFYFGLFR